jgi:hypothetical protein
MIIEVQNRLKNISLLGMAKGQEKVSLVTGMAYLDKVSFLCLHACVG